MPLAFDLSSMEEKGLLMESLSFTTEREEIPIAEGQEAVLLSPLSHVTSLGTRMQEKSVAP